MRENYDSQRVYRCIFDENTKLTKEHFFPKWLKRYLPKSIYKERSHSTLIRVYDSQSNMLLSRSERPGKLDKPGAPGSYQLRVVCRECNNGWMSKITESAKDDLVGLIKGAWTVKSTKSQVIITNWAILFTMLCEFSDLRTVSIPTLTRSTFKEKQIPPDNWQVWVGRYSGIRWDRTFWHSTGRLDIKGSESVRHDIQTTLWAVGKCIFQTVSAPPYCDISRFGYPGQSKFRRIWPPENTCQIYPPDPINDRDALHLALQVRKGLGISIDDTLLAAEMRKVGMRGVV